MKYKVTLAQLRKSQACVPGYNKVVLMLKGQPKTEGEKVSYIRFPYKEPISLIDIAENNEIDDALWCLRCIPNCDRDARLFAVWCARQAEHLNTDARVKTCNDVVERFANGKATQEELDTVREIMGDAVRSNSVAIVKDAALIAAWAAAEDPVWGAASNAAWAQAWVGSSDTVRDAVREAQKIMFIKMCNGVAPWQQSKQKGLNHA